MPPIVAARADGRRRGQGCRYRGGYRRTPTNETTFEPYLLLQVADLLVRR